MSLAGEIVGQILHSNKTINQITTSPREIVQEGVKNLRFAHNKIKASDMNETYLKRARITKKDNKYYNDKNEEISIDKDGYMSNLSLNNRFNMSYLNQDGSFNKSKIGTHIAGSTLLGYSGLSSAGRLASGGGLYRDSDGNFDLMGIPFI